MKYFLEDYHAPREIPAIIRPEINLAKWPQLFATRQTRGRSRIIVRGDSKVIIGQQIDNKGKKVEVGFLIVPDMIVLLGLIELWELNDRPESKQVTGRVRGFIEHILRRQPGGKRFIDLERSLKRLVHIPLNWVNAFFDSRTGKLESINDYTFRFLQDLRLQKMKRGEKMEISTFSFRFNDSFLQNLLSGSTKPLNLSELIRFKREISVLAYCFLDLVMAKRSYWTRKAKGFIRDDLHIESARYNRPAHRKEALEAILQELRGCRLSTGILSSAQLCKTTDGKDWKLIIRKEPFKAEPNTPAAKRMASETTLVQKALVEQMMKVLGNRQKNERFYCLIARKCPPELIHTALQDTLAEARSGKVMTSRAAFFGYWIQQLAHNRGIELGLKSSFTGEFNKDT